MTFSAALTTLPLVGVPAWLQIESTKFKECEHPPRGTTGYDAQGGGELRAARDTFFRSLRTHSLTAVFAGKRYQSRGSAAYTTAPAS